MRADFDKINGWDNPNYQPNEFKPDQEYRKSRPLKDNYRTIYKKDYRDKTPNPKSKSFKPEYEHLKAAPFVGDTTYKDLTSSAKKNSGYSPMKRKQRKAQPRSEFKDRTIYNVDYDGKRPKDVYRDDQGIANKEIFGGTTKHLGVGPMKDKTIYRRDYTPKRLEKSDNIGINPFEQTDLPRPQYREKKTNYMREYTPKIAKIDGCDIDRMTRIPQECRNNGDHIHYDAHDDAWYNKHSNRD